MTRPGAEVAVERQGGLAAERQGPLPRTLADHPHDVVLEVEVLKAHAEQLGAARAGVQQHHQQRGVAAGVEVLAGADGEQDAQLRLAKDRDGHVGHGRRLHLRHRSGDVLFLLQPTVEGVQPAVAVVGGGRLPSRWQRADPGFDVLAAGLVERPPGRGRPGTH
jgi:hypothetical protein